MTAEQRFFAKVNQDGPVHPVLGTPCWLWTAAVGGNYGNFWDGTRYVGAHRWSYQYHVGPIPEGEEIDHRCHVKICVNPEHLRSGTRSQNHENWIAVNSQSGVRGVVWTRGAWQAYAKKDGRYYNAGRYATLEAAEAAAVAKRNTLFTFNDLDREITR